MSFYATINNFIAENAIIFSVIIPIISGSIGAYVSYRVNIKSEKRKEFNLISEPILEDIEFIEKILNNKPNANHNIYFEHKNIDLIKRRLSPGDVRNLLKAINEYNEVATYVIKNPAPYFGQPEGEWVDKYDEAIKKLHKLKKNFELK